jgi:hypothetical protein
VISPLIFFNFHSPINHLRQYEFAAFNGEVKTIHELIPIRHLINLKLVEVHHLILKVNGNDINGNILF